MDEKLKTRAIIALGLFSLILVIVSMNSFGKNRSQEQKWRREAALRMDAEEKAQKSSQEAESLSSQLKKNQETLQENGRELETVKKSLLQEQMVNQNLKAELDKLSRLKQALEEDLKEALISQGKTSAAKPGK